MSLARLRGIVSSACRERIRCGAQPAAASGVDEQLLRRTIEVLSKELPPGRVAAVAAQLTGATRAAAYALATRAAHDARESR